MWDSFNTTNGGGFMNVNHGSDSPAKPKKEQVRRIQNVVPLVTSLIRQCPDEDFTFFGMSVQIADIVGVLKNFEIQSTKATCRIEDHTGSLKAILWLEADNDTVTALPPVKEDTYVRAFGSIRHQDGENMMMILKMFPVDDYNIVLNHLLNVIHVRLEAEKISQNTNSVKLGDFATTSNKAASFAELRQEGGESNPPGLKPVQLKVLQMLKRAPKTMGGIHKDYILSQFRPDQVREVREALDFLLDEGHAYTTVDNDSYKATDSA